MPAGVLSPDVKAMRDLSISPAVPSPSHDGSGGFPGFGGGGGGGGHHQQAFSLSLGRRSPQPPPPQPTQPPASSPLQLPQPKQQPFKLSPSGAGLKLPGDRVPSGPLGGGGRAALGSSTMYVPPSSSRVISPSPLSSPSRFRHNPLAAVTRFRR